MKKRMLARAGLYIFGAIVTLVGYAIDDRKIDHMLKEDVREEVARALTEKEKEHGPR